MKLSKLVSFTGKANLQFCSIFRCFVRLSTQHASLGMGPIMGFEYNYKFVSFWLKNVLQLRHGKFFSIFVVVLLTEFVKAQRDCRLPLFTNEHNFIK